jgi:signal transduction histidine kinase
LGAVLGLTLALVITLVLSFGYQLHLKDQEILVWEVYGDWNRLLDDAKNLATSPRPLNETSGQFEDSLAEFHRTLDRLMPREGTPAENLLGQKLRTLGGTLAFGVPFLDEMDGWVRRLKGGTERGAKSLMSLMGPHGGPPEARWTIERLGSLDGLFGKDLSDVKDLVRRLILQDLDAASRQSTILVSLILGAFALLLAILLAQVYRLNARLNLLVLERTRHLEQAQARLVASEKLAVLGRLAAGVSHELNTPLAALHSAGQTLRDFFANAMGGELRAFAELSAGNRDLVESLAAGALVREEVLWGGSADRKVHQRLKAQLESRGIVRPGDQADCWMVLGLGDREDIWGPLCDQPQMETVLTLARQFVEVGVLARVVVHASEKSAAVVSALRNYLEGGRSEAASSFSLRQEWESVLVLLGTRRRRGVRVILDVPEDLRVVGSRSRLNQVWTNLATNALQAMGTQGCLEINARQTGETVTIEVRDTGPGVPPAIADQIFQPFFTTKPTGEGLGLGLDLCQKIVEAHGGTLSFESEPGRTVFRVVLPVEVSTEPQTGPST